MQAGLRMESSEKAVCVMTSGATMLVKKQRLISSSTNIHVNEEVGKGQRRGGAGLRASSHAEEMSLCGGILGRCGSLRIAKFNQTKSNLPLPICVRSINGITSKEGKKKEIGGENTGEAK